MKYLILALILTGCELLDPDDTPEPPDTRPAKVETPRDSIADPYPNIRPPSPK